MTTTTNNQSSQLFEGSDKFINVLKKLEGVSHKLGYDHYQERLHRIAKTIRSIEAHAFSCVSEFLYDDNMKNSLFDYDNEKGIEAIASLNLNNNEYLTVINKDNKKSQVEGENNASHQNEMIEFKETSDKNFVFDFNDLLKYIETELGSLKNDEVSESSDSDEDETEDKSMGSKTIKTTGQFRKRFFNIEIKLRAFLKQQEKYNVLKNENFQSFVNQQRLKTPMTKNINPNPSFIKNFFEESKKEIEGIKKRRLNSIFDVSFKESILSSTIGKDENKKSLLKSEVIKSFSNETKSNKKISNFEEEMMDIKEKPLRQSLFKNPYAYGNDGNYINEDPQELLDKDDIVSRSDDNDEDEDEDDYEEIEIEVNEEIEVDEDEVGVGENIKKE